MTTASSPGKIILFGEHAVVYGYPAIAVPLAQVRAYAHVEDSKKFSLHLPDLKEEMKLIDLEHPLGRAITLTLSHLNITTLPSLEITVTSQLPIASGLGSGAAIASALIRALLIHLHGKADNESVNTLTYEVEKIFHGTPSGIDNTVVTYEQPVYFKRGEPNTIEPFTVGKPLTLLVADTGVSASTKEVVGDVRRQWEEDKSRFDALFTQCGAITDQAKVALGRGDADSLGKLMFANHAVLQEMTVSCAELDRLVGVAVNAGAFGAKMSGAGRGGNLIALVSEKTKNKIASDLLNSGAKSILSTELENMSFTQQMIVDAHKHSSHHRDEIITSDMCGCFYCLRMFPPSEISE